MATTVLTLEHEGELVGAACGPRTPEPLKHQVPTVTPALWPAEDASLGSPPWGGLP